MPQKDSDASPGSPALESWLLTLWRRLLEKESLAADDHLFDAGATSLHVLLACEEIKQVLKIPVGIASCMDAPDVRDFVAHLVARFPDSKWNSLCNVPDLTVDTRDAMDLTGEPPSHSVNADLGAGIAFPLIAIQQILWHEAKRSDLELHHNVHLLIRMTGRLELVHLTLDLSLEQTASINRICAHRRLSRNVLLVTLVQKVVAEFTETDRFHVAVPVSLRAGTWIENTIGMFSNTGILCARVRATDTWDRLLERVRTEMLGMMRYRDVPYGWLYKCTRGIRIAINPVPTPVETVLTRNLRAAPVLTPWITSRDPLSVFLLDRTDQISISWAYHPASIVEHDVQHMVSITNRMLGEMLDELDPVRWTQEKELAHDLIEGRRGPVRASAIETTLNGHSDILKSAVLVFSAKRREPALAAFIVARKTESRETMDVGAIRSHCLELLARHGLAKWVIFTRELPRDRSGRLIRSRLQERLRLQLESRGNKRDRARGKTSE